VKKMEITQHSRYTCSFCGKDSVKRQAVGIWCAAHARSTATLMRVLQELQGMQKDRRGRGLGRLDHRSTDCSIVRPSF
jgi:hypothetical protein